MLSAEPSLQPKKNTWSYSLLRVNKMNRYKLVLIVLLFLSVPTFLYFIRMNMSQEITPRMPYQYPSLVKYSYQWPSSLDHNTDTYHDDIQNDIYSKIDQKYCKQDRCQFLLPIAITEQESKAQLHFRHLAFLSGEIGRTIVLPNVYKSHLSSCFESSFDYYYDKSWLEENKHHFNYITMEEFKSWLEERHNAGVIPTGQEIYIQGTKKSPLLPKYKNCFHSSFNFDGRPIVNYQFLDSHNHNITDISNIMKSILSNEARQHEYYHYNSIGAHDTISNVDVINLYYDRRYKIVTNKAAQKPLEYSQRWVDIADNIVSQMKPFVAIHWRMERLEPVSNLIPCAKDLVDQITDLHASNVFLLTDYPHLLNTTGAKPESSSFLYKELKPEHHQAIEYLYQHLNVSLTSIDNGKIPYEQLPNENWHILPIKVQNNKVDRSVLGIVDKLVAMRAQWFFAGKPGICAKSSSFTSRISSKRLDAFKDGDKNILLPIKNFDIKV